MVKITPDEQEEMFANVDLIGRTGAKNFEFGYLHDNVPIEEASWYAQAQYRGAKIIEENHKNPLEAIRALALRLLTGAKCNGCGGLVALDEKAAFAFFKSTLMDGTKWNIEDSHKTGQCHWKREGSKWTMGCKKT